ncbi:MAG: ribosome biogenesis GTP-binding protein YihA/YsxC [Steroidobacteraceae bacterium]|jgi:GTP-binding protein|nr:ribosome biogenesis GTP-binding protein YihA/YsxC [Steroidobacteraceae bacterium]
MAAYPNVHFLKSAHEASQFCEDFGAEVAFAGRSNSGKSSAINVMVQRRDLARTSRTPGRTQLVNFFELGPGERLVDLPGYGYAQVPPQMREHWRRLMDAYFGARSSLAGLFIVMDARRPLAETDWRMIELARSRGCPVHVLLSKADKLGGNDARSTLQRARAELGEAAGVQLFSALNKNGVDEARAVLGRMLARQAVVPDGAASSARPWPART